MAPVSADAIPSSRPGGIDRWIVNIDSGTELMFWAATRYTLRAR